MQGLFLEQVHLVKGLDPVADAFDGTVRSDVVNLKNYGKVVFLVYKGVGTTGTSTITIEASDDVTPSNTTAVAFAYRRACNSGDAQGTVTQATTAGFTTTAGSSEFYIVEIDAQDLAASGYHYASLKAVESVNSPVLAGIAILMLEPRNGNSQGAIT